MAEPSFAEEEYVDASRRVIETAEIIDKILSKQDYFLPGTDEPNSFIGY